MYLQQSRMDLTDVVMSAYTRLLSDSQSIFVSESIQLSDIFKKKI